MSIKTLNVYFKKMLYLEYFLVGHDFQANWTFQDLPDIFQGPKV
jgi:hypothetical protein